MNSRPANADEPVGALQGGPGRQLRAARESAGLALVEAAASLHLSEAMVAALEADDYAGLGSPVFVRGYLRNYARLLGMDPQPLLAAYQVISPEGSTVPPLTSRGIQPEIRSSHPRVRLVTWLLVIGLGVLLIQWWRGELHWSRIESEEAAATGHLTPETVSPEDGDLVLDDGGETTGADAIPDLTELEPSQDRPSEIARDLAQPTLDEAPDIGSPPVTAQPEIPQTAAPEPSSAPLIVLEFAGPCWVEIRDRTGKRRLSGEIGGGQRRVLEGQPPFQVTLGNSQVVRLTIDGQPFDLTPYTRGNVARFRLDPYQSGD